MHITHQRFCPAAAAQADAVALLLTCVTATAADAGIISKSLNVLRCLLAVDSSKAAFMQADGADKLVALLSKHSSKPSGWCPACMKQQFMTGYPWG